MSPAVTAAILAASVSFLTLVVSLVTQFYGIRRTSRDAEKTIASNNDQLQISLAEQRQQLNRTLAEQRQQLDRTLGEQREHLDRTLAEQRERTLNERFATAADRLGSDKPAACDWLACTRWRDWPTTGPKTGKPASMCCAHICECHTHPTQATTRRKCTGLRFAQTERCGIPSSASLQRTCAPMRTRLGPG
jgi:hypothetical protein